MKYDPYKMAMDSEVEPHMPSFDPQFLDPRIRNAVAALRAEGLLTFTSCQSGPGHAFRQPTIGLIAHYIERPKIEAIVAKLGLHVDIVNKYNYHNPSWPSQTNGEYIWLHGDGLLDFPLTKI